MSATWDDGTPRSSRNAFTGHTGVAPLVWSTPGTRAYATRVSDGLGAGLALDAAGRATIKVDAKASGLSIATAADKKFKHKQGAAI